MVGHKFRNWICSLLVLIFAIGLSGCIKTENDTRVLFIKKCINNLCSFQLVEANVQVSSDVLGKEHVHVLSQQPLEALSSNIQWVFGGGSQPTSAQMTASGLPACGNDDCSETSNPTGRDFGTDWGQKTVSVTGSVKMSNGKTLNIDESSSFYVFPTQVTYQMPAGSTITAEEAAALFNSSEFKGELQSVIGTGGVNGTLTFICKDGEFMAPSALNLSPNQVGFRTSWEREGILTELPTPTFYASSNSWGSLIGIAVANNSSFSGGVTGADCGVPI